MITKYTKHTSLDKETVETKSIRKIFGLDPLAILLIAAFIYSYYEFIYGIYEYAGKPDFQLNEWNGVVLMLPDRCQCEICDTNYSCRFPPLCPLCPICLPSMPKLH